MKFDWDDQKSVKLKMERGVSFEDVVFAIANGGLISTEKNTSQNHPEQQLIVVQIWEYIYLVPFVEEENGVFLKTIIPSRKATKKYLGRS